MSLDKRVVMCLGILRGEEKGTPTRVRLAYEGFKVDSWVTWEEGLYGIGWQEVKEGENRET